MGSQNPTGEKNKSPVGEEGGKKNGCGWRWRGGQDEGEMERKMERKERSWKKKRATKQQSVSGACRARQVDTETK